MRRPGILLLGLLLLLSGCAGGKSPSAPVQSPSKSVQSPSTAVQSPSIPTPSPTTPAHPPVTAVETPAAATKVATAGTRFAIDMLKQVYQGQNTFLSPISASLILSLTASGAAGETQGEMLRALRFESTTIDEVNQGNQALQSVLTNPDPKVSIHMANGIWHRDDLTVAPAFAALAKERYGASIENAAFGSPEATAKINDWTAKTTRGRIPKLLESTNGNDVMILVNAIHFKGAWTHAFDPKLTREALFHRPDGTVKLVRFMQQEREFATLQGDGFAAVRLPYGKGRVGMYLFVPDDLSSFVTGLTAERWEGYMQGFAPRKGTVLIPKVKLEATHKLNEPLQAMGMQRAFGAADFSGLFADGRGGVAIRLVLQKSFLEMNEEGTEAAAATAVVMTESYTPPILQADRPFLLAIRDEVTGALLFLGTVVDP